MMKNLHLAVPLTNAAINILIALILSNVNNILYFFLFPFNNYVLVLFLCYLSKHTGLIRCDYYHKKMSSLSIIDR